MVTATPQKSRVESLYAKYGPTIYARCRRILRNQVVAEDATQDVFVKVLRYIESAPDSDSVLPWIHRITTNHCLNMIRASKRDAEPVENVPEVVDDEFENDLVTRNFANHVLSNSPEVLRTPAMLYHGKGMDQSKVAATLGVSRRTVLYRLAAFTKEAVRLDQVANA